jgi:hypothetical protein
VRLLRYVPIATQQLVISTTWGAPVDPAEADLLVGQLGSTETSQFDRQEAQGLELF